MYYRPAERSNALNLKLGIQLYNKFCPCSHSNYWPFSNMNFINLDHFKDLGSSQFTSMCCSSNYFDVDFKIISGVDNITEVGVVRGKRSVLSDLSPVFKELLQDESKSVFEIRGASFKSFRILNKFLHCADIREDLNDIRDVNFLFEIYNLGNRFQVNEIKEIIKNCVQTEVKISERSIVSNLRIINIYKDSSKYEDLVKVLRERCLTKIHECFQDLETMDKCVLRDVWRLVELDLKLWKLEQKKEEIEEYIRKWAVFFMYMR